MNRDMDFIRTLLLQVEESEGPLDLLQFARPAFPVEAVLFHAGLLADGGLVITQMQYDDDESHIPTAARITRLTGQGAEFLAAAKNESVWRHTKAALASMGDPVSLTMFEAALISLSRVRGEAP